MRLTSPPETNAFLLMGHLRPVSARPTDVIRGRVRCSTVRSVNLATAPRPTDQPDSALEKFLDEDGICKPQCVLDVHDLLSEKSRLLPIGPCSPFTGVPVRQRAAEHRIMELLRSTFEKKPRRRMKLAL
jgi:hypothetical protein